MSKSHTIRTILSLATTALFVTISAVLVVLLLPGTIRPLSVQTGSMEPNLSPGHLVLVRKQPIANYNVGDVITYVNPSNRQQTITHRITERSVKGDHGVFVTKGDANAVADQPISELLIVGKVVGSVPHAGRVIDFTHSWLGLALLIYVPALLIMAAEMRKLIAYYRSIKPYSAREPRPRQTGALPVVAALLGGAIVLAVAATAGTALAATTVSASLTGNTISTKSVPKPPVSNCSSNTDVNVQQNSQQSAQSGSASVQGNTSGGSAQSGSASNSNSSNVNIQTQNGSCKPSSP